MYMKNFLHAILCGLFVCSLSLLCGTEGPSALNPGLSTVFSGHNQYGWRCTRPPALFQNGLTPWLETDIYLVRDRITPNELETLYVEIYRDLSTRLNSQRPIRPYLSKFPLTPENFFVTLTVECEVGKEKRKLVSTASLRQGMLELDIETLFGRQIQRKQVAEIPPLKEFALPRVPRTSHPFIHRLPFIAHLPCRAEKKERMMFEAAEKICRKHNLKLLALGGANKEPPQSHQLVFFGSSLLSLEKAKKLSSDCALELLKTMKKEFPVPSAHEKKRAEEEGRELFVDEIVFRISFWDDKFDRPKAPSIAEIRFFKGESEYYTADENQQLVLILKEAL